LNGPNNYALQSPNQKRILDCTYRNFSWFRRPLIIVLWHYCRTSASSLHSNSALTFFSK